jgi:hypothetical protein
LKRVRDLAWLRAAIAALTFNAGTTHLADTAVALFLAVSNRTLRSGGAYKRRCALRHALIDNIWLNTFHTLDTEL